MVRCLITQYTAASISKNYTKEEQDLALEYVKNLQNDHDNMCKNIMTLRSDYYLTTEVYDSVRPSDYNTLVPIPGGKLSFMYASKRYAIPFGWFVNPLPSTTSTSWVIMLQFNFNPFKVGGDYIPYNFELSEGV